MVRTSPNFTLPPPPKHGNHKSRPKSQLPEYRNYSIQHNMGPSRNWLRSVRNKVLCRPTRRDVIVVATNHDPGLHRGLIKQRREEEDDDDDDERGNASIKPMMRQPHEAVLELLVLEFTPRKMKLPSEFKLFSGVIWYGHPCCLVSRNYCTF